MPGGSASGPAAPAASLPATPHHLRPGAAIDALILSLEAEWHLGLRVRGADWSPARSRTDDQADRVCGLVKRLFYSAETTLNQAIAGFREVAPVLPQEKRLDVLCQLLSSKVQKNGQDPISRTGTPKNDPPKSFKASLIAARQTRLSGNLSRNDQQDEPDSYTTAVDPGSPTDVDTDDELVTPRSPSPPSSPSPSSRLAQRRVQASPFISLRSTTKKRPSDSFNMSSKSPKLTKTSQGKQTVHSASSGPIPVPPLFKKPSLDMARSFQATGSGMSSVNTSFNDSAFSSQRTNLTTNTSFTSYDGSTDMQDSKRTRTSSITIGSLDDYDITDATSLSEKAAFELDKQKQHDTIFSQDLGSRDRSTFGSIDEDGLCDVLCQVEEETRPMSVPSNSSIHRIDGMSATKSFPSNGASAAQTSSNRRLSRPRSSSMDVPPLKGAQQTASPAISPLKEPHYIRSLPEQNLFVDDPPQELSEIPYFVLFISQRIAAAGCVSLQDLMKNIDVTSFYSNADSFWTSIQNHPNPKIAIQNPQEHNRVWQAAKRRFDGYTFKGQLHINPKRSGQVFNLQLQPIHADKSCRFQRKFGSDRFLYLTAPVFDHIDYKKIDRFNKHDMRQIELRWKEWLANDHVFLGRRWRVFHVEPFKKGKGNRKETTHDKRIVLFATEGWGIDAPCSIGSMLNWFLPFARNQGQSFCKAYARLDLGLSRTVPTLVFKPSQIQRLKDRKANGEQEDSVFNDKKLHWESIQKEEVMNDGCSVMSVGAAQEIWRLYKAAMGLEGRLPLPSAFQGRIAGAKGLWMISGETSSRDPKDTDIWIQITDSQEKFERHSDDYFEETCDRFRLTFEVSNYSATPSPSELHISFIPIMVDRGVPRQVIAEFMTDCLNASRCQLLDVLTDAARTYDWLYRNGSKSSKNSEILWQAALPVSSEEKVKLLLESGFTPMKFPYLARNIERFITTQHIFQEKSLRTPLGKSTFLFGVADPLGVLKPGEIHVQFSTSFVDEMTETNYLNLRNTDVLVSRQPACRRSDIQKVRAVVCPELNHLVDLVVFPSRGEYPLAGKLQGGDYDGDIFWLCWESKLVEPFSNAPAPVRSPDPTPYGIDVNRQTVKDIMNPMDLKEVDKLLQKAFEFRLRPSFLGRVTVFLEKQAYRENRVFSPTLDNLCGLHDLLVDAPKQGYTFTEEDFNRYIKHSMAINNQPKVPAYKAAMDDCLHFKEIGDIDKARETKYRHKPDQLLDYLYFDIVRKHNIRTIEQVKTLFSTATTADELLLHPYTHLQAKQHAVINEELRILKDNVAQLYRRWASGFKKGAASEQNDALVDELYRDFRALQPTHVNDPEVKAWLEPYTGPNSFSWDDIRASTLYAKFSWPEKANFVFKMAGRELVRMKARSIPDSTHVVPSIYRIMRPKRIKAPIEYEEAEDEESEDEFVNAMEQITE
ncbi:Nn.00g008580.m01.CDS01 [Neocucurbitaria sp. VM-36]